MNINKFGQKSTIKVNSNNARKINFKKLFDYVGKLISSAALVILLIVGTFLVYYLISAKMVAQNPNLEPKINLYTIVSGSMTPNINVYDVVVDYRIDNPEDIKVGDVITFKSTSNISKDLIVTHRVVDIKQVNGKIEYVTKGDYNATADSDTAKFDNIIGKVVIRFPQLGRVQFLLANKMGWFIIVLLPATCVIIYDIFKLIKLVAIKKSTDQINGTTNLESKSVIKEETVSKKNTSEFKNNHQKTNKIKEIITKIMSKKDKKENTDDLINETIEKIKKTDYIDRLNDLKKYDNKR